MVNAKELPRRKQLRVPDYDYASPGAYFFTMVTRGRLMLFGEVVDDEMRLNECGRDVMDVLLGLPARFRPIELDELVVMPNHVHGVLWLTGDSALHGRGEVNNAPTPGIRRWYGARIGDAALHGRGAVNSAPTLGLVMRAFKSLSARLSIDVSGGRDGFGSAATSSA